MAGQRFPREFLIAELKRIARLVGGIPSMNDFRRSSKIAPETLVKRFGGWRSAISSAGFDPVKASLKYQDADLIEELRRVASHIGRTPASTEFHDRSAFSS